MATKIGPTDEDKAWMDRINARIEPDIDNPQWMISEASSLVSIAISLRRIADMMERERGPILRISEKED